MPCRVSLERMIRRLGMAQVAFGALAVVLGIFDMYMSWQPYIEEIAICGKFKDDGTMYYPCEGWNYSRLIGAIGVPLWVGKYFIVTGSIALRIQIFDNCSAAQVNNRLKTSAFRNLCIFGFLVMSPALVSFVTSEVILSPFGRGYVDDGFPPLKWMVPTIAAGVGTALWLLCVVAILVVFLGNKCGCLIAVDKGDKPVIQIRVDRTDEGSHNSEKKKRDSKNSTEDKNNNNARKIKKSPDIQLESHKKTDDRRFSSVSDILCDDDIQLPSSDKRRKSKRYSPKKRGESRLTVPSDRRGSNDANSKWPVRRNSGYADTLNVGRRQRREPAASRSRKGIDSDA